MLEDLNAYYVFYEVARLKSMHAASQYLDITPVTVTRTIHGLENSLGHSLLNRTSRGVTLTEEGAVLYDRLKYTFDSLNAAQEHILVSPAPHDSVLTIGLSSYAPRGLLLERCLPKLSERFPNLQITLRSVSKNNIADAILNDQCSFVFAALVNIASHNVTSLPLFSDKIVAVTGKKYSFLAKGPVSFEQLKEIPLVSLPMDGSLALRTSMLYRYNSASFRPSLTVPDMEFLLDALAMGNGYSFLPACELPKNGFRDLYILDTDFDYFDDVIFSLYFASDRDFSSAEEFLISTIEHEAANWKTEP